MIDPRRLRVLEAVALHGSVTTAAEALFMSASAVSQQLSALEREVGYAVFERGGRRLALTATGRVLAGHAARLSTLLEEAEADLAASAMGQVGDVAIAGFTSAITEVIAPAIVTLRSTAPRLRVHVKDAEGPVGQRLLLEGQVDLAVAVAHLEDHSDLAQGLSRSALYTEPFDALLPQDYPFADSLEVRLSQLADDPWITPWPGNPIRDLTFFACEEAGFQPRVESVSNDFRAICSLVAAGSGVAVAPRSALRGIEVAGLRIVPISVRPPTRKVFVLVRRGAERHPLVASVVEVLHDQARVRDWDAS